MILDSLLNIYFDKYGKRLTTDLRNIKEYSQSEPQETKSLLSLYKIRNEGYKERNGKDNDQFKKLISDLEKCNHKTLIMHIFRIDEFYYMLLTDIDFKEVIAELKDMNV